MITDFGTFFTHLMNFHNAFVAIFGTTGFAIANSLYKRIKAYFRGFLSEIKALETASTALLHYQIFKLCNEMISQGYSTVEQLNNLEYFWNGYRGLGGNGTGEQLYKQAKSLPIKNK